MRGLLLAALLCIAASAASAGDPDSTKPVSATQSFVTKATQDGMVEIQLGQLALSRSSDPKVKEFAAQMVQDHTQANAELAALAKRKNLDVPTSLDDKHATIVHAVGTKPPSEFDAEYSRRMIDAHDAAATLFSDASAVGDKDVAEFAEKTLTTIHRHQRLAATLPAKRPPPAGADPNAVADPDAPTAPQARAQGCAFIIGIGRPMSGLSL